MVSRDIFEIRGNINPSFSRIEQLTKEREEREKAERDARWAKEREERERLDAEWKSNHPILSKFTYMSRSNYETYSWPGEYCNIHFYEWSDINNEPKHFPYLIAFYRFIDECKINLTETQNSKLKCNTGCHITCVPNTHDLIIGISYDDLKNQFNASKVISSVPDVMPTRVVSNVPCKVLSCVINNQSNDYA